MTPKEAVQLGELLLTQLGLRDWSVISCPVMGDDNRGWCDYQSKSISLHEMSGCCIDTVVHEVAHALTPGSKHGVAFEAVRAHIMPLAESLAELYGISG